MKHGVPMAISFAKQVSVKASRNKYTNGIRMKSNLSTCLLPGSSGPFILMPPHHHHHHHLCFHWHLPLRNRSRPESQRPRFGV